MPEISVIVVTYNSAPFLASCLVSLHDERVSEIIVVDNASSDGSCELVVSEFPAVRLLCNESNLGFARAANQGFKAAKGEYLMVLNPDAELLPGSLERMVEFLNRRPETAAVAPRHYVDSDRKWQWGPIPSPPHWRLLMARIPLIRQLHLADQMLEEHWAMNRSVWMNDSPVSTSWLSGACLLARRRALEAVGWFDEDYFLFFEDLDLSGRLVNAGWCLAVVPTAYIVHTVMGSVRNIVDRGEHLLYHSGRRYCRRHADVLTTMIWSLMQKRPSRKEPTSHQRLQTSTDTRPTTTRPIRLMWDELQHAAGYLVEIALDPSFLYGAGCCVVESRCDIPQAVIAYARGGLFFWRVTALDERGSLGESVIQGRQIVR
jgi:GT2 family glycosyltransferase